MLVFGQVSLAHVQPKQKTHRFRSYDAPILWIIIAHLVTVIVSCWLCSVNKSSRMLLNLNPKIFGIGIYKEKLLMLQQLLAVSLFFMISHKKSLNFFCLL